MTFLLMLAEWMLSGDTIPANDVTRKIWLKTFKSLEGRSLQVFDGFSAF